MKKLLLSLSIAALCVQQAPGQESPHFSGNAAVRHVGDASPDTNRYVADYGNESGYSVGSDYNTGLDLSVIAPTTYGSSCDIGCSGGCGSSCGESCGSSLSGCSSSPSVWFTSESLLWFAANRNSPVLATTSAQSVLPVSGAAGVTDAFGGSIDSGILPGYRLSGGVWVGPEKRLGLGGRVYGILSNAEKYSAISDGSTSLGVPFFNMLLPGEDAYLVGFTNGANPVAAGTLNAREDLDMVGAEGSGYFMLGRSRDHRVDLVAGYTFNKLKNSISLQTASVNLDTGDAIPNGTIFNTHDLFETENTFNGAHLGVLSSVVRKRVSLSTLAKISFGNMRQTTRVWGSTLQQDVAGDTGFVGGLFAQASNIGTSTRDEFGFIPELGLKLGYSVRENVQLTVGYSFLMWSSVALAGEQIDRSLDLTQTLGGPAASRPSPLNQTSAFWMQGIDLGMSWCY